MSTELAVQAQEVPVDEIKRIANMLYLSGYFVGDGDQTKQVAQLATKILAGREMGYQPFAAVNGIHVIKGKPILSANLMAAAVKSHSHYDYRVTSLTDKEATVQYTQDGEVLGESTFTLADAKAAGVLNNPTWSKFPRNMLFARAMSNGVRWFCPDVFAGNVVYTAEELGEEEPDEPAVGVSYSVSATQTVGPDSLDDVDEVFIETPEPAEAPAAPKAARNGAKATKTPTPAKEPVVELPDTLEHNETLRKAFHATGTRVYGDGWKGVRDKMSAANGVESSNDLTVEKAKQYIAKMEESHQEAIKDAKANADANDIAPGEVAFYAAQAGYAKADEEKALGYAMLEKMTKAQLESFVAHIIADVTGEAVDVE